MDYFNPELEKLAQSRHAVTSQGPTVLPGTISKDYQLSPGNPVKQPKDKVRRLDKIGEIQDLDSNITKTIWEGHFGKFKYGKIEDMDTGEERQMDEETLTRLRKKYKDDPRVHDIPFPPDAGPGGLSPKLNDPKIIPEIDPTTLPSTLEQDIINQNQSVNYSKDIQQRNVYDTTIQATVDDIDTSESSYITPGIDVEYATGLNETFVSDIKPTDIPTPRVPNVGRLLNLYQLANEREREPKSTDTQPVDEGDPEIKPGANVPLDTGLISRLTQNTHPSVEAMGEEAVEEAGEEFGPGNVGGQLTNLMHERLNELGPIARGGAALVGIRNIKLGDPEYNPQTGTIDITISGGFRDRDGQISEQLRRNLGLYGTGKIPTHINISGDDPDVEGAIEGDGIEINLPPLQEASNIPISRNIMEGVLESEGEAQIVQEGIPELENLTDLGRTLEDEGLRQINRGQALAETGSEAASEIYEGIKGRLMTGGLIKLPTPATVKGGVRSGIAAAETGVKLGATTGYERATDITSSGILAGQQNIGDILNLNIASLFGSKPGDILYHMNATPFYSGDGVPADQVGRNVRSTFNQGQQMNPDRLSVPEIIEAARNAGLAQAGKEFGTISKEYLLSPQGKLALSNLLKGYVIDKPASIYHETIGGLRLQLSEYLMSAGGNVDPARQSLTDTSDTIGQNLRDNLNSTLNAQAQYTDATFNTESGEYEGGELRIPALNIPIRWLHPNKEPIMYRDKPLGVK